MGEDIQNQVEQDQLKEGSKTKNPTQEIQISDVKYQFTHLPYILILSFSLFDLYKVVMAPFLSIFLILGGFSLILAMLGFISFVYFIPKLLHTLWIYWIDNGLEKTIADVKNLKFETPQKIVIVLSYSYFLILSLTVLISLLVNIILNKHLSVSLIVNIALIPAWFVPFIDTYLLYVYRDNILNKMNWIPKTKLVLKLYNIILGIVFILVFAVTALLVYSNIYSREHPALTACTADAKVCPDGSTVGRGGPKCEFAPCPTTKTSPIPEADMEVRGIGGIVSFNNLTLQVPTSWHTVTYKNSLSLSKTYIPPEHGDADPGFQVKLKLNTTIGRETEEIGEPFYENVKKTTIVVDGKNALQIDAIIPPGKDVVNHIFKSVYIPVGNDVYVFYALDYGLSKEGIDTYFDQILSTFKFTNQSSTVTPTCTPRPRCLDETPACLMPELESYCDK